MNSVVTTDHIGITENCSLILFCFFILLCFLLIFSMIKEIKQEHFLNLSNLAPAFALPPILNVFLQFAVISVAEGLKLLNASSNKGCIVYGSIILIRY